MNKIKQFLLSIVQTVRDFKVYKAGKVK